MKVGVDVGTVSSRAASGCNPARVLTDNNANREIPSLIKILSTHRLFGRSAQFPSAADRVISDVRRNDLKENGVDYAMLLENLLKQTVNDDVTHLVATVPVCFTSSERVILKQLIEVVVPGAKIRVVNESTAAAVAYGVDNFARDDPVQKDVLIFKLGAGFLDVAVADISWNSVVVKEAFGERLGGIDFTRDLAEDLRRKFSFQYNYKYKIKSGSLLLKEAEDIKRRLRLSDPFGVSFCIYEAADGIDFKGKYTSDDFRKACKSNIKRLEKVIRKIKSRVCKVVLIGGGSRMQFVEELLTTRFPGATIMKNISAEEAAVQGAGILAEHFAKDTLFTSVAGHDSGGFYLREISSHEISLLKHGGVVLDYNSTIPSGLISLGNRNHMIFENGVQLSGESKFNAFSVDAEGMVHVCLWEEFPLRGLTTNEIEKVQQKMNEFNDLDARYKREHSDARYSEIENFKADYRRNQSGVDRSRSHVRGCRDNFAQKRPRSQVQLHQAWLQN
ncbi:unnamed protein product [Mesocestoides corti]|uniref:Heat shock 70 kDa protein 14 n=1 Tax=Mesocestoides corti TaxID=53468 RepID=A0A0R3U781_MESCO|nr:unnamed protein product [Mesocestoides corti]